MRHCGLVNLIKKCDGKTRATTPNVPAPPPHILRVVKSLMFCARALLDGWQPWHTCLDIRQAGDRRLSLNKKARNTETCDLSNLSTPPSCIVKPPVDGILGVLGSHRGQQCERQRLLLWCLQLRKLLDGCQRWRFAFVLSTRVRAQRCSAPNIRGGLVQKGPTQFCICERVISADDRVVLHYVQEMPSGEPRQFACFHPNTTPTGLFRAVPLASTTCAQRLARAIASHTTPKVPLFLVRNQVYQQQKMSVSLELPSYHVYHVSYVEVSYPGVAQVINLR